MNKNNVIFKNEYPIYKKYKFPIFVSVSPNSYGIIVVDNVLQSMSQKYIYIADNGYVQAGYVTDTLEELISNLKSVFKDFKICNADISLTTV